MLRDAAATELQQSCNRAATELQQSCTISEDDATSLSVSPTKSVRAVSIARGGAYIWRKILYRTTRERDPARFHLLLLLAILWNLSLLCNRGTKELDI
jgi:hypothetical protein